MKHCACGHADQYHIEDLYKGCCMFGGCQCKKFEPEIEPTVTAKHVAALMLETYRQTPQPEPWFVRWGEWLGRWTVAALVSLLWLFFARYVWNNTNSDPMAHFIIGFSVAMGLTGIWKKD